MTSPTQRTTTTGTGAPIPQEETNAVVEQQGTAATETATGPTARRSSLTLETGGASSVPESLAKPKRKGFLRRLLGIKTKEERRAAKEARRLQKAALSPAQQALRAEKKGAVQASEALRMHAADKLLFATHFALNQPNFLVSQGLFRLEPPASLRQQIDVDLAGFLTDFDPSSTGHINALASLIKNSVKASLSEEDKIAFALMAGIPSDILEKGSENKAAVEKVVAAMDAGTLTPNCTASFVNLLRLLTLIDANSAQTNMAWLGLGITPGKMMMPELDYDTLESQALIGLYQNRVGHWLQSLVDPSLAIDQTPTLPQTGSARLLLESFIQAVRSEMTPEAKARTQALVAEATARALMTADAAMAARKSGLKAAPVEEAEEKALSLYSSVRHTTASAETDFSDLDSDSDTDTDSTSHAGTPVLSSSDDSSDSDSDHGGSAGVSSRLRHAKALLKSKLKATRSADSSSATGTSQASSSASQAAWQENTAYDLRDLDVGKLETVEEINEVRMQIAQENAMPLDDPKAEKARRRLHKTVLKNLDVRERELFKDTEESATRRQHKKRRAIKRGQFPDFSSDASDTESKSKGKKRLRAKDISAPMPVSHPVRLGEKIGGQSKPLPPEPDGEIAGPSSASSLPPHDIDISTGESIFMDVTEHQRRLGIERERAELARARRELDEFLERRRRITDQGAASHSSSEDEA